MVRPYEVVYIFDPVLDEAAINQKLSQFHAMVQVAGADAPQLNHWGKRTLSYPIQKRDTGYYVVANFDADGPALPEFERALKLDDGVLRYLIVLNDEPPTPAQVATVKSEYEEDE